jgi:protein SCO1
MKQHRLLPLLPRGLQILLVIAIALVVTEQRMTIAAPVTIGGPFTLTATDGTTVTDETYRGKWLLVYFGYTSCPNTCPTTLIEIGTALATLGADAGKLQPLFITIDPTRDTAELLVEYLQSFDPRIVGLTGTPRQIAVAAQEYGVFYAPHRTGPGAEDYVIDHSSYLYLMDPRGCFARGFEADTPGDRIAGIVHELMAWPQDARSHGGSSRRREMRRYGTCLPPP